MEDIFADPHYRARNNIIELDDPVVGKVKVPNVIPKFSLTPGLVKDTGPSLGEHNEELISEIKEKKELKVEEPILARNPKLVNDGGQVLSGLRILDVGPGLAGPFGGTLLADFGAEVIKIEKPGEGDPLRHTPPFYNDTSLWWAVDGRNKKSITLDLKDKKGQEIFKKLVSISDAVIESFRPGTLEEWNLAYDELKRENERIILVRVSGFGQDGPYSHRPTFDAVGAAMGGFTSITGFPEYPPSKPSISIADYLSGIFTAISVMAAIYYRDRSGEGQWVDLSLYEPFCRFSHENIPVYHKLGIMRERRGNLYSTTGAQILFQADDGKWVAILTPADKDFARLARAIGREELAQDPRFATLVKRVENRPILNEIIAGWTKGIPGRELVEILAKNEVATSLVYSIRDIFEDPHYQSRGNIIEIDDPLLGKFRMQDVVPKLSLSPGRVKSAGPSLGQHNEEIFKKLLGYSQEELYLLRAEKIV
jgi:crotonobetainyl-CoA:carnitine CoA-transferase CaiB-like acyl-CoA transferase